MTDDEFRTFYRESLIKIAKAFQIPESVLLPCDPDEPK